MSNEPAAPVELLGCPFCDGRAEQRLTDGLTRGFIGCFSCMIGTPFNVPYGEREREAWNTRSKDSLQVLQSVIEDTRHRLPAVPLGVYIEPPLQSPLSSVTRLFGKPVVVVALRV